MLGVFLYLVSTILEWCLSIPGLLHVIYAAIRRRDSKKFSLKEFNRSLNKEGLNSALAKDISGNVAYSTMLNDWFIKKGGYHYGKAGETISSATGKNMMKGTLTWLGKGFAGFLNLVDFRNWKNGGHCWVSIDDNNYREAFRQPSWYSYILWVIPFLAVVLPLIYGLIKFWQWVL